MLLRGILDEDFVNYRKPSLFLAFPSCTFKCEREYGGPCCQNSALARATPINVPPRLLVERYLRNPITRAVVCGGLEPLDSFPDVLSLLACLRSRTQDDAVIYTGYREDEVADEIEKLKAFSHIIVKFGRFLPGRPKHFDPVLGVFLTSENQYAEVIS